MNHSLSTLLRQSLVVFATATALVTLVSTMSIASSDVSSKDADKAKRFSLTIKPASLKAGADAVASVEVQTGGDYKWNKQYPAKLTIKGEPTKVSLAKTVFAQLKGDFKTSEKSASVSVPMTGKATGKEVLTAELRFSVCDKKTCVLEKEQITIAVDVAP